MEADVKVCYRCGVVLEKSFPYMALDYCDICRQVVLAMISVTRHDPPFGFPGNTGYLEPEPAHIAPEILLPAADEKKKEPSNG